MNKRGSGTLQDLGDATLALSQSQITPVLRGNFRMQGPYDEANCDLLTHMATPEICKGLSSCSESQKADYRGKLGTCNVCSAPCSSCFHVNNVLVKSNYESAGESGAKNIEIGQLSVLSTVAVMSSDSFSENAVGKTSSRTSNASSDDGVVHSKSEGRRVPGGHDDCLSCLSGTDEHANKKCDTEYSMRKYNKPREVSGESYGKVPPGSLQTGSNSQNSGSLRSTGVATGLLKVQNTSQASNGKYVSHDQDPTNVKDDKTSVMKKELLEGSTEPRDLLSPRGVSSAVCGDPPETALSSMQKNNNMQVEIQPVDETDDSDMMEQDVKVCDICGDAGREDLLAICCWCSDGAEHTYCMREMLAKVPVGEWLCEECQALERVGNLREEKMGIMDENEKNNSGHTSSEYVNSSDVEGQKTKGYVRIHSKRHRDDDDAEVSSVVKRPALESKLGSSRPSSFGKTAALCLENSVKNLDKSRLQSSDDIPVNDATESANSASDLRVHNLPGTFSKSNSFSSLNSKPRVKLVDQVIMQRQKSAKEPSTFHHKEGVVRSIGKSMSFKSTNSGRSESKVKTLSSSLSHIQDIRNTKQRSSFERSFRAERSSNSVMGTSLSSTSRINRRPASRGESFSLATITNHHEIKPVQADRKSVALSRSSSLAARKAADVASSSGEFKRPSMHVHCTVGVSSANAVNNNEHKYNQTSLKEDPSCSVATEGPALGADEGIPDGLPRRRDLTDSGDGMKECSGSHSRPPSAKSSRDDGDNLRAAIEAAVLRKPGVYRRHRAFGQPDDSSMPSLGCEVASHQDPISSSVRNKKLSSDAELKPERPTMSRHLTADSLKQENSNLVKQSSMVPVQGLPPVGQGMCSRDVLRNVPAVMPSFLKSIAVPEHEYIWQGSFEICRSGKTIASWDGMQAHLSTCASPKVSEAVNKLNSRILLYEVPRLSTWPIHFQEHGVREDNIAVFFFAKDLESYDKIYKVLLDNMMENDLALKGNVNGVELLIFPSSQLPDNSQRWNMLFFLWGVFRGKKESCLQSMPESLNQFRAPRSIPPPIMSLPEIRCSLRPITEDLHEREAAAPVPTSEELRRLLSSRAGNTDSGTKSLNWLDHRLISSSVQSDSAKECQERRGASQEGIMSSSCSPPLGMGSCTSSSQVLMQLDTPLDEGSMLDKARKHIQMKSSRPADPPENGGTLLNDHGGPSDLNNNRWLFNEKECMLPPGSLSVVYADDSQVPPRNDVGDDTCGKAERHFFPKESHFPWKMHHHPLEQQHHDRVPDLELALGAAERKSNKVNEVRSTLEEEGRATKAELEEEVEDINVAAASLSLSLSFPFPNTTKPDEQRQSVETSSMLFFGNLKDK